MRSNNALFSIGRPFSPIYSLLMRLRESLYRKRLLPVTSLEVPVVSIGNLTLGGTGKTPVVQYIAGLLQDQGLHPAIISRGYGGKSRKKLNIVSRGEAPLLEASFIGDEPRLLAESLKGVPVLTGPVRKHPARHAVEMGADVLVLDDGFQHMALDRHLDLVLFNADSLAGNSRVFPGGDLREPVKALNRSHAFILTGTCGRNRERAHQFAELLSDRFPNRPVFLAEYKPVGIFKDEVKGQPEKIENEQLRSLSLFAFSGIARPESFEQTLHDLDIKIVHFHPLPDHFIYNAQTVGNIELIASQKGADALITTEKDMVKLKGLVSETPLFSVHMKASFDEDFHDYLLLKLAEFHGTK